jgi:hypothetical protein
MFSAGLIREHLCVCMHVQSNPDTVTFFVHHRARVAVNRIFFRYIFIY